MSSEPTPKPASDEAQTAPSPKGSSAVNSTTLEQQMEHVFLADRAATRRLGWISTFAWSLGAATLTVGGVLAVLLREDGNEGLRIALVAISVPGLFAILLGVVTAVLWSKRSQRLTLETLQERLARIEALLRNG